MALNSLFQTHRSRRILSEFYQLRRTTIKDLAAYIGFLAGFIGAAPFAWGLLSGQLASGSFVRGLWYFFGIVIAAGIFGGIIGMGLGYIGGVIWEQIHRHRRAERLKQKAVRDSVQAESNQPAPIAAQPRLQLVNVAPPDVPQIEGRLLSSVRFHLRSMQLDFAGIRIDVSGNVMFVREGQRIRYPDAGSRDALCSLIGDRVAALRVPSSERLEIQFESGSELVIPRTAFAVA